ncbi:MAG: FAD-dependent oxidoreductase [Oscillospiraceae bacterium]|nr:FAD-dependent oxidoreductase [Oscillospiraceae bacterium]
MEGISYTKVLSTLGHYDVVVLGGGPAGCCAAVEAARNGAKTLLLESTGMLGGMATSGMVGPFMTSYDRDGNRPVVGGLFREIISKLADRSAAILPEETDSPSKYTSFIERYHRHVTPFDAFSMQVLLDEMTEEAGVEVMLYTKFADCICEDGKIKAAVVAALEGLRCVTAELFIDCTGTAAAAAAAGVPTWKGEEESGIPQPGTLMFEVSGAEDELVQSRPKRPIKVYLTREKGTYRVNHEHVFNVDAADSRSMSAAHREARRQVVESYRVLKEETPGFAGARIGQVAPVFGVRESRHIKGLYTITVEDVSGGTRFPDRIAAYGFGMDVHIRSREMSGNFKIEVAEVYYVPYRSMVPVNCSNLLVAGKTISCYSQAAGGLRCMPCAMAMGQAAGAAASIAVRKAVTPAEVPVDELQDLLLRHGAILD